MIQYKVMPARPQRDLETTPFHEYVLDDDTVWTEFYRAGDNYLLRFPGLADFDVSADGSEVTAHPAEGEDGADEATLEHLYVNQLVPLAMSRQGRPAFHASVVSVPGGVVAFLGQSGAGKSTLAASFALHGSTFLTDDALIIEESDGRHTALPSHASLRLWEDSVEALVSPEIQKAGPISYSTKARLLAGDALNYGSEALPLLAAYVLGSQDSDDVVIEPVNGLDRYMGWLNNSFLLDIEDNELLSQHFEWTHRISGAIPTFTLDYPRDYGKLPQVRNAVVNHVKNHGS